MWHRILPAAALLSVLLAGVAAYNRTPWSDEGWFSSAAYNLARHGFMGTTVIDPTDMHLTRVERRTYCVMPLYLVGQALWLKLFPATLFAVRLFSVVWIPVAIFSLYRFLWRVTANANVAALAGCLFGLSFIFIENAGFGRPDLMCCALGLSGLAAYVEWRTDHFRRALFVSNALIAASGLTHPNGVFHLIGLIAIVLYYDRRRLNFAALSAAVLPYIVFGAVWALYIFQDFGAFADQMRGNGTNSRWTATLNPLRIIWDEIHLRYARAFGLATRGWALLKLPVLLVYLAAIGGAIFQPKLREQPSTRLLLLLVALYFGAMAVFNQKLAYYLIHILPWYIALTAVFVVWLWERSRPLRPWLALAMIGLVSLETGGILLLAYSRSQIIAQEQAAIDFALAHAQPRDRIVGTAALIYGFRFDARLRDDPRLGITSGQMPDMVIIEPIYRDLYDGWKTVNAGEMWQIAARLATYRLAFDNGECQVYLRPGDRQVTMAVAP